MDRLENCRLKINDKSIITFDIETTTVKKHDEYVAFPYISMFCIDGYTFYTRYFEVAMKFINELSKKNVIVWVHNLSYEFQFISSYLDLTEVFARQRRKVIKCKLNNLTFRCTLMLTGRALKKVAEDYNLPISKMTGDLDYSLIRNSVTRLSDKELRYCENDVLIVYHLIKYFMEKYGYSLKKIPLTKTGIVREYIQKNCNTSLLHSRYVKMMCDYDVYKKLVRTFTGGFTHCNSVNCDTIISDVKSIDFTSSYPSVMVRKKFPITEFTRKKVDTKTGIEYIKSGKACLFTLTAWNVKAKSSICIFSKHKANFNIKYERKFKKISQIGKKYFILKREKNEKIVINNGKIYKANIMQIEMTDIDFKLFTMYYNFTNIKITDFFISDYGYLPDDYRKCILNLYSDKTTLKNVEGQESNYLLKKEMVNSCYGNMVLNIMNNEIIFDKKWSEKIKSVEDYLKQINRKKNILPYQWGVWVTAWGRYELLNSLQYFNSNDFIYCDTDSIKYIGDYDYLINDINKYITNDIKKALSSFDEKLYNPADIYGNNHFLGVFDYEGTYKYFKTLGAKRYLVFKNGKFNITLAGCNKSKTSYFFNKMYDDYKIILHDDKKAIEKTFEFFSDTMYISQKNSGRSTFCYNDVEDSYNINVTDYRGNMQKVEISNHVASYRNVFTLNMSDEYLYFLSHYKNILIDDHAKAVL